VGLEPEELDLRQYFDNKQGLEVRLDNVDFVWIRGGNVFILRRALKQSGFDKILKQKLLDDAVAYGGYSAGSCILTPTLRGIELCDPVDVIPSGYSEQIEWSGLNLVPYYIAPHYKSDHLESASIEKVVSYFEDHKMRYRTLRDGEAIVINGKRESLVS
jgi:dipeptidase E